MKTKNGKKRVRRGKKTIKKRGGGGSGSTDRITYTIANQSVKIKLKDKQKLNFNSTFLNFMDTNTQVNFKFQVGGTSKLEQKQYMIPGMNTINQAIKQLIFNRDITYIELSQRDKNKLCEFTISAEGGGRQIYVIKPSELNTYKEWKKYNRNVNYHDKYNKIHQQGGQSDGEESTGIQRESVIPENIVQEGIQTISEEPTEETGGDGPTVAGLPEADLTEPAQLTRQTALAPDEPEVTDIASEISDGNISDEPRDESLDEIKVSNLPRISCYIQQGALIGNTPGVISNMRYRRSKGNLDELRELQEINQSKIDEQFLVAASNGDIEKIKSLAEQGANVNVTDENGHSAVYWANKGKHSSAIVELHRLGAVGANPHGEIVNQEAGGIFTGARQLAGSILTGGAFEDFYVRTVQRLLLHSLISTDPENDLIFINVVGNVVKKKLAKNEVIIVNPTTLAFWESTVDTEIIRPNGSMGDVDKEYWETLCRRKRDEKINMINKEYESNDNRLTLLAEELSKLDEATLINRARTQYNITEKELSEAGAPQSRGFIIQLVTHKGEKERKQSIIDLILKKTETTDDENEMQRESKEKLALGGKIKGGLLREKRCEISDLDGLPDKKKEDLERRLDEVNSNLNVGSNMQTAKAFLFGNQTGFLLKVTGPGLVIINGRRFTKAELNSQIYSSI